MCVCVCVSAVAFIRGHAALSLSVALDERLHFSLYICYHLDTDEDVTVLYVC